MILYGQNNSGQGGSRFATPEPMQSVPDHEDIVNNNTGEEMFTESVLDLSKYLNSTDLHLSPQEYFDEVFFNKEKDLQKPPVRVKEEPLDSTATSRCSTPDSACLTDADYEAKRDIANQRLQPLHFNFNNPNQMQMKHATHQQHVPSTMSQVEYRRPALAVEHRSPLFAQLQSIHHSSSIASSSVASSSNTSEVESEEESEDGVTDLKDLAKNAERLHQALAQLDQEKDDDDMVQMYEFKDLSAEQQAGGKISGGRKSRKHVEKGTTEYVQKRERNNVAVRKSRTKAKLKHIETQMRVGELTDENNQLRNRVNSLQKELDSLKSYVAYHMPVPMRKPVSSPFLNNTVGYQPI